MTSLWCLYYWLWENLTHLSIDDFEQVNAGWAKRHSQYFLDVTRAVARLKNLRGKFLEKHFVQFYLLFPETEGVSVPPQVPMICKIWTWGKGLGFLKILIYCIKKMKLLFKDLHIKCEQILKFLLIFTK